MDELVRAFTSLPNLHPAVVHFPIALLPLAVLFDVLALGLSRQRHWLEPATASVYLAAGAGAGLAYWAGERAADSLAGGLNPQQQLYVGQHSDWALYTIWLVGVLVVLRLGVLLWDRSGSRPLARLVLLPAAVIAVTLVAKTADLGGMLVYEHGIAVSSAAKSQPDQPVTSALMDLAGRSESRLIEQAGGGLTWSPLPTDGEALGSVLQPAPGADENAVSWQEASGARREGLGLAVDGRTLLLLPGSFGDVQIEAVLELETFVGRVGLAHHAQSATEFGLFALSLPAGETSLEWHAGEKSENLGRAAQQLRPGPAHLTVFAAGRHWRGLVEEGVVVHGHRSPLPPGGCGLFLDGRGIVRIHSVTITPVTG